MALTVSSSGASRSSSRERMAGTPQQEAIWAALVEGDGHLEVQSLAGTGKSTVAREGCWRLKEASKGGSIAYAAFNRHIAQEFQSKLPTGCVARTMHGLGFELVKNALGEVQVDQWKVDALAERYFPDKWGQKEERTATCRLVSLLKAGIAEGTEPSDLLDLAARHDVDLGKHAEDVLAVAPLVLEDSTSQTAIIDYDDMIYLPVAKDLRPQRGFKHLFLDESQDLSPAQHELAFRLLADDGRMVSIGDRNQAIYAFRGADADSMDTLASRLEATDPGLARLPLTVTWRCPKSHVELAKALVPALEAAPNAIEGEIVEATEAEALAALQPGDMALCRNNAPLLSACFGLIRRGVRAVVRGRDVGKGLLTLVARLRARTVPDLVERLDDYRREQLEQLARLRHPEAAIASLEDRVGCVLALCLDSRSVDELRHKVNTLFSDDDERSAVVFSTIHRAKGLERAHIAILRPDLLPHPAARGVAAQRQEKNLCYVGVTRSTSRLTFAGPIPAILARPDAGPPRCKPWHEGLTFDPSADVSPLD